METILAAWSLQQILITAVIGIVAGALARFILPGRQSMNWILTLVLGVAGAYVGGFVQGMLNVGGGTLLWQIIFATAGALLILVILSLFGVFKKKKS